jgi:hypothetical protein
MLNWLLPCIAIAALSQNVDARVGPHYEIEDAAEDKEVTLVVQGTAMSVESSFIDNKGWKVVILRIQIEKLFKGNTKTAKSMRAYCYQDSKNPYMYPYSHSPDVELHKMQMMCFRSELRGKKLDYWLQYTFPVEDRIYLEKAMNLPKKVFRNKTK